MPMIRRAAAAAVFLSGSLCAQSPLFVEVGEVVPDGIGQVLGVADYEGDGDDDLFSTVGVFLNEGGFFRPGPVLPATFDASFNVRSIAVADFNGDGRVDVLAGRLGGAPSGLALFLAPPANGPEFVAVPTSIGGAPDLRELAVADLDLDGDVDVVAAPGFSSGNSWQFLQNDGAGNFTAAGPSQWPGTDLDISWVAVGDFDGDGLPDVYASTNGGSRWRRNLGGGNFAASAPIGSMLLADSGCVGDFDGDGHDDIFLVNVVGDEVLHVGSAAGPVAGTPTPVGPLGAPPLAVDGDGDGRDELIRAVTQVSGSIQGELQVRPGTANGPGVALSLGEVRFAYGNPTPYPGVAPLDVDGDGDLDLVVCPGGAAPWTLLRDATGGYTTVAKNVPAGAQGLFAPPRDVDGDGDVDLVRAQLANGVFELTTHRNDGRGNLSGAVPSGTFSSPAAVDPQWVDLDGDGDQDLWVGALWPTLDTFALVNDGSGGFAVGATLQNVGSSTAVAFGDFNGDGLMDVVQGRPMQSFFPPIARTPVMIAGAPAPTGIAFAPPASFGLAELLLDIAVVDEGQDGDLDLLVCASGLFGAGGATRIYRNDGTGAFTALPPFAGVQAATLAVGDLNGDGVDDLVLGSGVWLWQNGSYVPHSVHTPPVGKVSLADLDEDGVLDLFDAGGHYYLGDGTGSFGAQVPFVPYPGSAVNLSRVGRRTVDFDGDGDLDVMGPLSTLPGHLSRYANRLRHLAPTSLGTPGQPLGMRCYGPANEPWIVGLSWPPAGGLALPPFGTLFLDPASMFVVTAGVLSADGSADFVVNVPANGGGFTWTWQALVGTPLRFTNSVDTSFSN